MRIGVRVAVCALLMTAAGLSLGECGLKVPDFVDEGGTYTTESVRAVIENPVPEDLASRDAAEAPRLRHEALVRLRSEGDRAARAADLLTSTFTGETLGVPYRVEYATMGGTSVLIVVEAIGRAGEPLRGRRLWVLDEHGAVLISLLR